MNSPEIVTEPEIRASNGPRLTPLAPHVASRHTMRDVLIVVFRERRLILLTFGLIVALGLLAALKLGTVYTAEARLLVLPSRDYVLRQDVGETGVNMALGDDRIVRSETEIFNNSQLVERVIEDLGLERLYPDIDAGAGAQGAWPVRAWRTVLGWFGAANPAGAPPSAAAPANERERKRLNQAVVRFISKLEVLPVKDSSVIHLTFSHPDAAVAAEALNRLILAYLEQRYEVFSLSRSQVFNQQRDNFAQRLGKAEQDLEAFKLQHDFSAFADQKTMVLRQQAEIQNDKLDTGTRLREIEGRLAAIREQLNTVPKDIELYAESGQQDARDTARATLVTLEARRNELLTKFSETSRFITDLDQQIAKLRAIISATLPKESVNRRSGRNPLYDELSTEQVRRENEAAALRARQKSLDGQLARITERLGSFDRLERDFNTLMLQRTLLEKNLQIYAQKAEEALIQEELDRQKTANVRVIEQAQIPREGKSLRWMVLGLSLVGGLVAALALAFLKDFFREVLVSPEDTERVLGLPVLVAVPLKAAPTRPAHA
ncbi:MAG TPA: hypothetical protein PLU26_13470 [Candidatus Competibacter sp.]|nr:hypothetical protein [Candidatus Competibacteraceae bacterium]HAO33874.1 hypothetical protein [Candidatus Competibacteraceae bacterium]HUM95467.1 hypothetical protein [Candidatus Competibacter sp.]